MTINGIKKHLPYILLGTLCLILLGRNIYLRLDRDKYERLSHNKEKLVSKQDSLINQYVTPDSTLVNQFKVLNTASVSSDLIKNKIDSMINNGVIQESNAKGKFYTRTSFVASLDNAKATRINDSISEYKDNNWYVNFNKRSDIINAKYYGESENILYEAPSLFDGLKNNKPLLTNKWFNDSRVQVTKSETIYVPQKKKDSYFNIYSNTEYRQGVTKGSGKYDIDFKPNTNSLYQGIGVEYRYKHHGIGAEYNQRIFGEGLNASEINIKYKYNLFK